MNNTSRSRSVDNDIVYFTARSATFNHNHIHNFTMLLLTTGVQLQIEPFQTGVRVTVRYEGARSIRVIIRDSNFRRHTQKGLFYNTLSKQTVLYDTWSLSTTRAWIFSIASVPEPSLWSAPSEGQCQDTGQAEDIL